VIRGLMKHKAVFFCLLGLLQLGPSSRTKRMSHWHLLYPVYFFVDPFTILPTWRVGPTVGGGVEVMRNNKFVMSNSAETIQFSSV
jgi:hypothetical protein